MDEAQLEVMTEENTYPTAKSKAECDFYKCLHSQFEEAFDYSIKWDQHITAPEETVIGYGPGFFGINCSKRFENGDIARYEVFVMEDGYAHAEIYIKEDVSELINSKGRAIIKLAYNYVPLSGIAYVAAEVRKLAEREKEDNLSAEEISELEALENYLKVTTTSFVEDTIKSERINLNHL